MKKHSMKKVLSVFLCMVLIAAMALMLSGCNDSVEVPDMQYETFTEEQSLGQGATTFTLVVCDAEGKETTAQISTDETILGQALLDLKLIAGEDSEYGMYIKTVNGITYDYDTDGKYWALYIDGEYALTGIDSTEIAPDAVYMLKAE